MRRRKVLTTGIALTSMGAVPTSSAESGAESSEKQNQASHDMEYLGKRQNRLYYKFTNNNGEKLNIIDRNTKKVYVREYSNDVLSKKVEKVHGNDRSTDDGEQGLVYDPNAENQESQIITSNISAQSTPSVIKRVGEKEKELGSCSLDCLPHNYHVLCVELNKHAATVSKAVVAGQVIKAMAKRAPKAIAKILKRDSIADALGGVISAAAGNVVSIGSVEWDQSVPLVRDQKMWTFKGGMTSWKPSRDAAGLTTFFALPRHAYCGLD